MRERPLLAGVMGWPVMQSRSPMLHQYWFRQHDLPGYYVPLAIKPGAVREALRALPALGFAGCNLTIPHKQDAMAVVEDIDDTARKIGAISCVTVRDDGTLSGVNNDCYGFTENILEFVPDWRVDHGPVVVMGAGGGARAVVYGLLARGATDIRLVNRTQARAETLAQDLGGPITVLPWSQRHATLEGATMLVNATSQGMIGQAPLDLSLDALPRDALVADIIYIPRETPLLVVARERGHRTVTGLGMLLHQGRPAWRSWFGIEPQVTPELRALIEATL